VTLSAQSLTKRYGAAPGYAAVRGVSLELTLTGGEFVSIVGRSGSGKSTLMAMLGALTRPTEGKLLLNGTDVWTLPETERATFRSRHVGFVFQFPSLLSNLTAVDNVAIPALLGRTMEAEEAYARAHDLLARVGLADRAEAYPGSMSGGEQRRVAVARALINAPPLLLADEPTSDLDEGVQPRPRHPRSRTRQARAAQLRDAPRHARGDRSAQGRGRAATALRPRQDPS